MANKLDPRIVGYAALRHSMDALRERLNLLVIAPCNLLCVVGAFVYIAAVGENFSVLDVFVILGLMVLLKVVGYAIMFFVLGMAFSVWKKKYRID